MDDGPVNELCKRVMSNVAVGSVSAVNFSLVPLLIAGVKPVCGDSGLRKQSERTQLAQGCLLRSILQVLECFLDRHA